MPRYSEKTDEGPVDFPCCPTCGEAIYSEWCPNCTYEGVRAADAALIAGFPPGLAARAVWVYDEPEDAA